MQAKDDRRSVLWLYVVIFALFFLTISGGVGQYWDWSFPYFNDQIGNIFANKSLSWTAAAGGSPLSYSTDYFLRFLISLFAFLPLQPETLRYILFVSIFAAGAFCVYRLADSRTGGLTAFLLGLTAFINPAIFYKYTAGHFNYLVAYTLFIFFIYFLFIKYKKDMKSAIILGLIFAFLGIQIQFFIFGFLFLVIYFLCYRSKFSIKYCAISLLIVILANLVWLSNFLVGGTSIADLGATAAAVSFTSSSLSDYLDIFTFSFSRATLLTKFYALYELLWASSLFLMMLWLMTRKKPKQIVDILLLSYLILLIFLGTGVYQFIDMGPLTKLYPMLREVGHFAPLIVLALILIIVRQLGKGKAVRWTLVGVLTGSLFIVGIKFQYFSQAINFSAGREQFMSFKNFGDGDTSAYRILTYPFFGKYSFNQQGGSDTESDFPLRNNGHDSFATFSKQEFINNAIEPHKFKDSVQYRLLQTYDIDTLRPYNIKYIYNFTDIYESNYERYVPSIIYDNDLSYIKNDKNFFNKLMAHNPGQLRKVNDKILEIIDPTPRIFSPSALFMPETAEQAKQMYSFTRAAFNQPLYYDINQNELGSHTAKTTQLFDNVKKLELDKSRKIYTQRADEKTAGATQLYINNPAVVYYRIKQSKLTIYTKPEAPLLLNSRLVQPNNSDSNERLLFSKQIDTNKHYFISLEGEVIAINKNSAGRIGSVRAGDTVEVFVDKSNNIISNPSFEERLWQKEVSDCNEYDGSPQLNMQLDQQSKTDGRQALQLSATRHNACTSADLQLKETGQYLLRFDYQGTNAQTANFHLSFNDEEESGIGNYRVINDKNWHQYSQLIDVPDGSSAAKLFLYAIESDGRSKTVNNYDNVSLVKLDKIQEHKIPKEINAYQKINININKDTSFSFVNNNAKPENFIPNPSFEGGGWRKEVSDCHDDKSGPEIAMHLDKNDKTAGRQSLELEATRHNACTFTDANVKENTNYLLAFDYKGVSAKQYGYSVSFNDSQAAGGNNRFEVKDEGWHRFTEEIHVPKNTTSLKLYIYAFETDGRTKNIVRYDNFELLELPDFKGRFYLTKGPDQPLSPPKKIDSRSNNITRHFISIQGATSPFILALSETYHPKWQLEMSNAKANGPLRDWLPGVETDAVSDKRHFKLNDSINGWYIDPQQLCQNQTACKQNSDGSYDMKVVAEFTPQRWFNLSVVTSSMTITASVSYLLLYNWRQKRNEKEVLRGGQKPHNK